MEVHIMARLITRPWSTDEVARLKQFLEKGASAARVAAALNRNVIAVQSKARGLGTPFPHKRKEKSDRLAREAAALEESRD